MSAKGGICPGECLPGGVSAQVVGCLPRWWGVCPGGGVSAQVVSAQGSCLPRGHLPRGVSTQSGVVYSSMYSPSVNRMTDRQV